MPSLGAVSYALASAGFLVLTVLLVLGRQGRVHGTRLVFACAATVLWGAVLAFDAGNALHPSGAVLLVELLRYAAWFVMLDGLARSVGVGRNALVGLHGAWLASVLAGAMVMAQARTVGGLTGLAERVPGLAGVGIAGLGLLFAALVWRQARDADRAALKPLMIAFGVLFGYDLLSALALFLPGLADAVWNARGLAAAFTVPMIAAAAGRNPHWSPNFFVSREVTFLTTATAVIGAYLLAVTTGSRWIVSQAGAWAVTLSLLFSIAAAVLLVVLLVSEEPRQRLRVLLNKHFYRSKYDYRSEWLRFIQTLSTTEPELDPRENAIRAIAQIIQSPGGVLFLQRDRTCVAECTWPKERFVPRDFHALPESDSMVAFLEKRQWVIDAREWRATPAHYGGMAIPDMPGLREPCRIILPLLHGARLIGFVALDDPPVPFYPNYEDHDLLKTVGKHVATYLAQHEADRRLAESRQFEAYHRLTAFVMHDLKNLAAQLALIVANAERHRRNPAFVDDTIATVANSTRRMQRLIEQLQGREVRELHRSVALAEVVRRACQRCELRRPVPAVVVSDPGLAVEADPEQLSAALEHAIRNAQDATPEDGTVTVTLRGDGEACVITVADTGCGMTEQFVRERLFKPFDTTKGSEGMGIGAYQLREYVRSIGGSVQVLSSPGRGTTFEVRLRKSPV